MTLVKFNAGLLTESFNSFVDDLFADFPVFIKLDSTKS